MARHGSPNDRPLMQYPTLEFSISSLEGGAYSVEPRLFEPGKSYGPKLYDGALPAIRLQFNELRALTLNPPEYGRRLTEMLFASQDLVTAFARAEAMVASRDLPLCIRLRLKQGDPALHSLAWELLRDPRQIDYLSARERFMLSRYIETPHIHRLTARPQIGLHALIAVANPLNLSTYDVHPIAVDDEVWAARQALGDVSVELAVSGPEVGGATLRRIADQLRQRPDIFYLVCHGAMVADQPYLFLEREDGMVDRVPGEDLVAVIRGLDRPPDLTVLLSCQSANGEESALAPLGPQLVEAGCPAVIAMRGNMPMELGRKFFASFFQSLRADGHIDRALAAARNACRRLDDWWRPVLYSGRPDGRLWSPDRPGRIFVDVPEPVDHYVPRAELGVLEKFLTTPAAQPVVACVCGEPGVGKTTLVAGLLHNRRTSGKLVESVVWLDLQRLTAEELLGLIATAIDDQDDDTKRQPEKRRNAVWERINKSGRPFLLILEHADTDTNLNLLLPPAGELPGNCRLIAIAAGDIKLPAGYRRKEIQVGPLNNDELVRMFACILDSTFAEQYRDEILQIGQAFRRHAQMAALVAFDLRQRGEHPATLLARLDTHLDRVIQLNTRQAHQIDLTVEHLTPADARLFALIAVLGEGDWSARLFAAVGLCSEQMAWNALDHMAGRGLLTRVPGGRFNANRLVRDHARLHFERLPERERQAACYLFARACLDLIADARRIVDEEREPAPQRTPVSPAVALVQRFHKRLRPDLGHIRKALVMAQQHQSWRLLQRFAWLASLELLDTLWTNADVVRGNLTMATLERPIFWGVGRYARAQADAALVAHRLTIEHPEVRYPLVIAEGYSFGERVAWPFFGDPVPRSTTSLPELSISLTASRVVEGVLIGYALGDARWAGVIAQRLLVADVDMVGSRWADCDLRNSVWLRCDLRKATLARCDLSGAMLDTLRMRGAWLTRSNLEGACLVDVDLRGASLAGANLSGATLVRVNLNGADLTGTRFNGAHLEEVQVSQARLEGSSWHGSIGRPVGDTSAAEIRLIRDQQDAADAPARPGRSRLTAEALLSRLGPHAGEDLRGISLAGKVVSLKPPGRLDLAGADLTAANLSDLRADMADLQGANLRAADVREARLPKARLDNANLTGAWLEGVHLQGAGLQSARLRSACLAGAQLQGAVLRAADLTGADLRGANLTDADLTDADLRGADLTGATVTPEQLALAACLEDALVPDEGEVLEVALLRGVYRNSQENFSPNAQLRYTSCAGLFERWLFEGTDYFGARLSGQFREISFDRSYGRLARLSGSFWKVTFRGATLREASLSGTFIGTSFDGANLNGARLSGTFVSASFNDTSMYDADLSRASLVNCDLSGAQGVEPGVLQTALRLRRSILPSGERYMGRFGLAGDLEDARRQGVDLDNSETLAQFYAQELEVPSVLGKD